MKALKGLFTAIALVIIAGGSPLNAYNGNNEQDSVVIKFGKGGRIVIHVDNDGDSKKLKEIDINEIVKKVEAYVDSAKSIEGSLVIDDEEIGNINVVYEGEKEKEDGKSKSYNITIDTEEGIKFCKDEGKKKKKNRKTSSSWRVDLGFNNYFENGQIPSRTAYGLNQLGSRYISVDKRLSTRLIGKRNGLRLDYGLGISWNNYMFNPEFTIVDQADGVSFEGTPTNTIKSKLVSTYLNAPLMMRLKMKNFSLAFGGYAGYKIHSHSKVVRSETGGKMRDKVRSDFHLNDFRYGLRTELKIKDVSLFGTYDLSPTFRSTSVAPNLRTVSFGISL